MNAPQRPARSLAARHLCMLGALLPGLLLQWREHQVSPLKLLFAFTAALVFEVIALLARRQPLVPYLREGSAFVYAALLVAWVPAQPASQLAVTLFVALFFARQAFGGLGNNIFHPVAAGAAFALVFANAPLPADPDALLASAWLLGGIALLLLRIVRWQAPVFLLTGALAGLLLSGQGFAALCAPGWPLAAFFIAGDSTTSAEDPRARALAAALAGVSAGLLGAAALPFAVLAMNAVSPLLDAWLDRGPAKVRHA